jgi:DNA-binding transcriptional MerR regulator
MAVDTLSSGSQHQKGVRMERLLETGSVSRVLDVSAEWVRYLADSGQLPPCALTERGRRLFRPADVEKLRRLREQSKAERG